MSEEKRSDECTCDARSRFATWHASNCELTRERPACPLCAGVDPVHISPILQANHAAHAAAAPTPEPTRDVVGRLVREHTVWGFCGTETACACDHRWRTNADYREHLADALAAALAMAGAS